MIDSILPEIEQAIIIKDYTKLHQLFSKPPTFLSPKQKLFYDLSKIKSELFTDVTQNKYVTNFVYYNNVIEEVCQRYADSVGPVIVHMNFLGAKAFLFEVSSDGMAEKEKEEKKFMKELQKLGNLIEIFKGEVRDFYYESKYFQFLLLEIYTKKCSKIRWRQVRQELDLLDTLLKESFQRNCLENKKENKLFNNPSIGRFIQKLYNIVLHLKLSHTNTYSNHIPEHVAEFLQYSFKHLHSVQSSSKRSLIDGDTVVVLLYNSLKNIIGFNDIDPMIMEELKHFYEMFRMSNPGKLYSWHVLQFFFIIKIVIFKENEKEQLMDMSNKKSRQNEKVNNKNNKMEEGSGSSVIEYHKIQVDDQSSSHFGEKFSDFLNINMDEIVVALRELTRNIIRHKVASLATIIGVKLGLNRFSKNFLEIMHDSPFNNDIQTIKLCFELFESRQYNKIQNLLQTVLSVQTTNKVKQKEVLVAMWSILTGLYLENRSEALLYCKMNHSQYLEAKKSLMAGDASYFSEDFSHNGEQSEGILKEETLLEHVGFAYYNLACNEVYLDNRKVYLVKGLQNFLNSYQLNKENYLLNYCIGKIYLQLHDYQNAYRYAMQACKSYRGSWAPFCLLSCVYICERKFQKSNLLVEELLKKHKDVAVLYYVKAYLEVNKILLDVEHDEEIQSAKLLGHEFYISHFERILKLKSIKKVLENCQFFYQLSTGLPITDFDENYFSTQNLTENQCRDHLKQLSMIIRLFFEISQHSLIEALLKLLPSSNHATMFYKAMLHEKRKQWKEAHHEYHSILKLNPCHCDTLVRLAMLVEHDLESCESGWQYLELAEKFTDSNELMLAKGVILSRMGKISEANQVLLEDNEVAWCEELPDLFYYY